MSSKLILAFILSVLGTQAFGQGVALITPMSDVSIDPKKILSFSIFNRVEKDVQLLLTHYCNVDGKELKGSECKRYFNINYSSGFKGNRVELKGQQSVNVKIQLKDYSIKYALFKPKYEPEEEKEKKKGIRFIFGYQPGFLYLVKPNNSEKLKKPKAKIVQSENFHLVQFDFGVKHFSMPQIINMTARITDKKTKKTIKLVKLATNKIVDPAREELSVQGVFAEGNWTSDICYELYIKPTGEKATLYKYKSCNIRKGDQKTKEIKKKKRRKKKKTR